MLQIRNFMMFAILSLSFGQMAMATKSFGHASYGLTQGHPALVDAIRSMHEIVKRTKRGHKQAVILQARNIEKRISPLLFSSAVKKSLNILKNIKADIRDPSLSQVQKENRITRKAQRFENTLLNSKIFNSSARPGRITLNLNGQRFNGQQVIGLKSMAKQQLGLDFKKYRLVDVVAKAKSRQGRAEAKVRVGRNFSYLELIPVGHFKSSNPNTYHRVRMTAPTGHEGGVWQLYLQGGNVRIDRLTLRVRPLRK